MTVTHMSFCTPSTKPGAGQALWEVLTEGMALFCPLAGAEGSPGPQTGLSTLRWEVNLTVDHEPSLEEGG